MWCCNIGDGNGWFGDAYFDVYKWKRALKFMAEHMKSWPAATAMSLRNVSITFHLSWVHLHLSCSGMF